MDVVNKHWFTFYISQAYSTVEISLLENESVINKVLYSPFGIGKYATNVNLFDIQKPENLNEIDLSNDILALIMKQTPNVLEVNIFQSNKDFIHQDWLYFSTILINSSCWKLQLLPILGEGNIFPSAYYYACAYFSRHTLKKLELAFIMLSFQSSYTLKEFAALESLDVHKSLIGGLEYLGSLLQFTPNLQELTIRFTANRVCQPMKKEYTGYYSIKKLWLYTFTPQHNDELLIPVKKFSTLQDLYIFGEKDKKWLHNINDPLVI